LFWWKTKNRRVSRSLPRTALNNNVTRRLSFEGGRLAGAEIIFISKPERALIPASPYLYIAIGQQLLLYRQDLQRTLSETTVWL
jgi:hypothetical protein